MQLYYRFVDWRSHHMFLVFASVFVSSLDMYLYIFPQWKRGCFVDWRSDHIFFEVVFVFVSVLHCISFCVLSVIQQWKQGCSVDWRSDHIFFVLIFCICICICIVFAFIFVFYLYFHNESEAAFLIDGLTIFSLTVFWPLFLLRLWLCFLGHTDHPKISLGSEDSLYVKGFL